MAKRKLVWWPDFRLAGRSDEVKPEEIGTDAIQTLIKDMIETMRAESRRRARGSAGGRSETCCGGRRRPYQSRIHQSRTITPTGEFREVPEGCLSVPGVFDTVARLTGAKVKALNENGQEFTQEYTGLLAQCMQHEFDHMEGRVFVCYLPKKKQRQIREYMTRAKKGR
jgi:peptide deformylase